MFQFELNFIPVFMASYVFSIFLILLTIALQLTSQTVDSPNYSIGPIMTTGIYLTSIPARIWNVSPYITMLLSISICAVLNWLCYKTIFHKLVKENRNPVLITLTTLALAIVLTSLLQIVVEWVTINTDWNYTVAFIKSLDYSLLNLPGVFVASLIIGSILFYAIRSLGTSSWSIVYRAITENFELTMIQGVNTEVVYERYWILSGMLAGLAGGIIPLWFHASDSMGFWVMPSVLAVYLLVDSDVCDVFQGGLLMGFLEILGTTVGVTYVGVWVGDYRMFFAVSVIIFALYVKSYRK